MIKIKDITFVVSIVFAIAFFLYMIVGVSTRVDEIKKLAPVEMPERNWEILRYEGYELGSMWNHGGKVWYHVRNIDDKQTQYRVRVTLWGGELHFHYGKPEQLNRVDIKYRQ